MSKSKENWMKRGLVGICVLSCLGASGGCVSVSRGPELVDGINVWHTPPGTVITRPDGTSLTVKDQPGVWARRDVWDSFR